ncbi:MAG TPA: TIGR03435 family protein [Gemmatimonadales bacterium]|nr:TIGR03435 family protein [Gemmatimonadales bacterium]
MVILPFRIASSSAGSMAQGDASAGLAERFDAASVKESPDSRDRAQPLTATPGGVTMRRRTVVQMIHWAYNVPERDIVGGPTWARTRRFDVVARTNGAPATDTQLRMMMRSLLAERFSLDATFERGVRPVYALTLSREDGKLGSAMRPSTAACDRLPAEGAPLPGVEIQRTIESRYCGVAIASGDGMVSFVSGMRATAGDIARGLSGYLDRPVVDRTGLTAEFDFILMVTPPGASSAGPATGWEIFTAIREQLGLKLEADRGETEVLVIRRLEPPTGN